MKHLHFLAFALCWLVWGHLLKAQSIDHYSSLDPSQPIEFKGNCLRYADKEIILGPKTFFVDGQLSDREVADNPYVFNSFNKAAANFSAGTEAEPMKVYLAAGWWCRSSWKARGSRLSRSPAPSRSGWRNRRPDGFATGPDYTSTKRRAVQ